MHKYFKTCIRVGLFAAGTAALLLWPALARNACGQEGNGPAPSTVQIRIDTTNVTHTMAGGAGASWHAMGPLAYSYKDLIPGKVNRNSRGSGWGGNPPL